MKRNYLALILCIIMGLSFTACSKKDSVDSKKVEKAYQDSNVNDAGVLPVVKDKITLNLGVREYRNVQDYDTNAYTLWLEEQTNIDLEFTRFPVAEGMEKLRLLVASDSQLPDVLINFGIPMGELVKYGEENLIVNLHDMIDKYGHWTKKMFEETQDPEYLRKCMTTADGAMYFMPYFIEQTGNDYGRKAFINQTWLDKLGLKFPTTTQELVDTLRAFKEKDPNGNGKADEIGITGSKNGWNESVLPFLMNSFVYDDTTWRVTVNNGVVSPAFTSNEWREGLRYMNKLAKEGLLDTQCLTQDSGTLKTLAQNPEVNVIGAVVTGSPDGLFQSNSKRLGEYTALPPMIGPGGVGYAIKTDPICNDGGVITKYCKSKLAAFRLLDFMMSEEATMRSRYGVPGVDWTPAQQGDESIFKSIGSEAVVRTNMDYLSTQNSHWYAMNPQFRSLKLSNGIVWNGNELDGEYVKAKALSAYINKEAKERVKHLTLSLEERSELDTITTDIKDFVKENLALFVIGKRDIEKGWDSYIDQLKKMQVDRYVELIQKGYDNYNSK